MDKRPTAVPGKIKGSIGGGSSNITPDGDGITKDYPNGDGITARPNNDGISPGDIKPFVDPSWKPGV